MKFEHLYEQTGAFINCCKGPNKESDIPRQVIVRDEKKYKDKTINRIYSRQKRNPDRLKMNNSFKTVAKDTSLEENWLLLSLTSLCIAKSVTY